MYLKEYGDHKGFSVLEELPSSKYNQIVSSNGCKYLSVVAQWQVVGDKFELVRDEPPICQLGNNSVEIIPKIDIEKPILGRRLSACGLSNLASYGRYELLGGRG